MKKLFAILLLLFCTVVSQGQIRGLITTQIIIPPATWTSSGTIVVSDGGFWQASMTYKPAGDPYPGYFRIIVPDISKNYTLTFDNPSDLTYSMGMDPSATKIYGNVFTVRNTDFKPGVNPVIDGVTYGAYPRIFFKLAQREFITPGGWTENYGAKENAAEAVMINWMLDLSERLLEWNITHTSFEGLSSLAHQGAWYNQIGYTLPSEYLSPVVFERNRVIFRSNTTASGLTFNCELEIDNNWQINGKYARVVLRRIMAPLPLGIYKFPHGPYIKSMF